MVEKKNLNNSDILKYHLTELLQTRIELQERIFMAVIRGCN